MIHEGFGPQFELEDDQYQAIDAMLQRKEKNHGVVIGYHGTSASRARMIEANGFENRVAVDQRTGVFAWDETMKDNAKSFGKDRAKKDGDSQYAVIVLEMTNPEPDYLQGRNGEWKAYADQTKVLSVQYYSVDE
jgi:hypothetical protein